MLAFRVLPPCGIKKNVSMFRKNSRIVAPINQRMSLFQELYPPKLNSVALKMETARATETFG